MLCFLFLSLADKLEKVDEKVRKLLESKDKEVNLCCSCLSSALNQQYDALCCDSKIAVRNRLDCEIIRCVYLFSIQYVISCNTFISHRN